MYKKLKLTNLMIFPILTFPFLSLSCNKDEIVYYDIYEEIKKANTDLKDEQITKLVLDKTNQFGGGVLKRMNWFFNLQWLK